MQEPEPQTEKPSMDSLPKSKAAANKLADDDDEKRPTLTLVGEANEKKVSEKHREDVQDVFYHWVREMHTPKSKLDDKRYRRISEKLKEGYTIDELKQAITGCSLTPWNMGENPRGKKYNQLQTILKDADQIERFIEAANATVKPEQPPEQQNSKPVYDDWNQEIHF